MPSLWRFGGLTPLKLIQLTIRKVGEDELSTRSAALSYYFLLSLFPMLLFLVSLVGIFAGSGSPFRDSIASALGRIAPGSASTLVHSVLNQTIHSSGGVKLAEGIVGALWAASTGVGAVITSLNKIYHATETRPWWKQNVTVVGLTLAIAALIVVALVLVLYGGEVGRLLASRVGLGSAFSFAWKVLQWPVAFAAMFLSYSIIYYFGPAVTERTWHWISPGAALGVILWLAASVGFRFYLHFFNSYSKTYGSLGAAIILVLWLYITGFAILIGGVVNWIIENEDKQTAEFEAKRQATQQFVSHRAA